MCGKLFPKKYNYDIHMKRHLKIKDLNCNYCEKRYYDKSNLLQHTRSHHPDVALELHEKKPVVTCSLCEFQFITKLSLCEHMVEAHGKEYPYKCFSCNKGFVTKDKCAASVRSHSLSCGYELKKLPTINWTYALSKTKKIEKSNCNDYSEKHLTSK